MSTSPWPGRLAGAASRIPGIVILLAAVPVILGTPRVGASLLVVGLVYLLALMRWPHAWLIVLPLVSVALDLTSWTGRFLFNELDWFFLLTISAGFLYGQYDRQAVSLHWWCWPALLYLALLLAGLERWSVFVDPPGRIFENPYYHIDYGYKLAKGAIWGALLAPLWLFHYRRDRDRTVNTFVAGCVVAALVLGLIIIWERGTLGLIIQFRPWWHIVQSVLDLTWSYRVTGLFSDMHTGGEVLDGMIVLLMPPALYAVLRWRRPLPRIAAALAAVAVSYCTLVGFTRATYATVALLVVILLALELALRRSAPEAGALGLLPAGVAVIIAAITAPLAFTHAGSYGLAAFGGLQGIGYAASRLRHRGPVALSALFAVAVALAAMAVNAHYSSRWVTPSTTYAVLLAVALLGSAGVSSFAWGRLRLAKESDRLIALACLIAGSAMLAFGTGGTQINTRMESVSKDFDTRAAHWRRTVASGCEAIGCQLWGNGAGSFPRRYLLAYPEVIGDVGSFSVRSDEGGMLRLGAGRDLAVGQRLAVRPATKYLVQLQVRTDAEARMTVSLCERNLLFASNFNPRCASARLQLDSTEGEFAPLDAVIDSGRVGEGHFLGRWPTLLQIKGRGRGNLFDVSSLVVLSEAEGTIYNSDFRSGTDFWFFYNDFAHLPWHVKNTWLHFWYETGWLGLASMIIAALLTLVRAIRLGQQEPLLPALATAIVALGMLGMFGTPMDSARVGWLFYFCLFAVLLLPDRSLPRQTP